MKIRIILFSLIVIACSSQVMLGQSKTSTRKQSNAITHVTSQMARKIKYAFDTNENVKGFIYAIMRPNSVWEMHEKMDGMLENPDEAKPIINQIFDIYGDGDMGKLNFLDGFGFTVQEVNLATKIYREYTKELEIKKAERKKQEEKERQERILQEKHEEETLLSKWNKNGVECFSSFNDKRLSTPSIHIELMRIGQKYDENPTSPSFDKIGRSSILVAVNAQGVLTDFKVNGPLIDAVHKDDIIIDLPAQFEFEHIDTIIPVPCNYTVKIDDKVNLIGNLQCKVKFNKKKNIWEIELLDKTGFFDNRYGVEEKYNEVYRKINYNHNLSNSSKDAIAYATVRAINSDEEIKNNLIKGKHIIDIAIYNHQLSYTNGMSQNRTYVSNKGDKYDCQPYVVITNVE